MFTLTFKTDNSSFGESEEEKIFEVKRILKDVSDKVSHGVFEASIRDLNGNVIGKYSLK